jgi:hypothetical protein
MQIAVYARRWSDEYLDLLVGFGTPTPRFSWSKAGSTVKGSMLAKFTLMDSAGIRIA